jgi:hypothetical protein
VDEINLDSSPAVALVSEGCPTRAFIKAEVSGKQMVMSETAEREFQNILSLYAGPRENARALRLLGRIMIIQDNPSPRARKLQVTQNLGANDIVILGTGDMNGIETLTGDRKAISAARSQAVNFRVIFHASPRLKGV